MEKGQKLVIVGCSGDGGPAAIAAGPALQKLN